MLIFITIHNEGFSQVKETKITAVLKTSTHEQSFETDTLGDSEW